MKCRVLYSTLMESFQLEKTVTGIRGSSTQRRQYRVHRVVQCMKLSALRSTSTEAASRLSHAAGATQTTHRELHV